MSEWDALRGRERLLGVEREGGCQSEPCLVAGAAHLRNCD